MTDAEVLSTIAKHQPLNGAKIPSNIKHQLGATHVAGKYFFTTEPYLIEGCKKMTELGYGVAHITVAQWQPSYILSCYRLLPIGGVEVNRS